jgi:hypothetical protein
VSADWVPTARLRWVAREVPVPVKTDEPPMSRFERTLEQWWTADLPSYMRRANEEGEWREVVTVEDAP